MAEEEILKQDEINALLEDEQGQGTHEDSSIPKSFDFSKQDKIIRGRMPTLEMIHDRFIRNYKLSIYNLLKKNVEIVPESTKIMKYSEYVQTLPKPSSFNIVKVAPLKGNALFVMDGNLVFSLVETYFGGDGKSKSVMEEREFTPSEQSITQKFLNIIFKDYMDAWHPIYPIECQFQTTEMNPGLAKIVSPSDLVLVCPFKMDMDAGGGLFHVVFPHAAVEPIKSVLEAGVQSDRDDKDDRWGTTIQRQVLKAEVELRCLLAQIDVTLKDIVGFKAGDVLHFEMPSEAVLLAENIPLYKGKFGVHEEHYALKINGYVLDEVKS